MHSQCHCDVRGFAKRSMLCGIVAFAEMVYTITKSESSVRQLGLKEMMHD